MTDEDERLLELNEQGHATLKAADGLDAEIQLLLEIAARGGRMVGKNLDELAESLVAHFGSPENAIEALKLGIVKFQKEDEAGRRTDLPTPEVKRMTTAEEIEAWVERQVKGMTVEEAEAWRERMVRDE